MGKLLNLQIFIDMKQLVMHSFILAMGGKSTVVSNLGSAHNQIIRVDFLKPIQSIPIFARAFQCAVNWSNANVLQGR
jgi:hypothetical protein